MAVDRQQDAFALYDLTQQEAEAIADVLAISEALFPGLRMLTGGFEDSIPMFQDRWYHAPAEAHWNTVMFARYLHDALLPAVQHYYSKNRAVFAIESARVYAKDLEGFTRAVEALYDVTTKKGTEEMERAASVAAFVFSQPGLRENVERMRREYEEGKRIKWSDTGLSRKRA